MMENVYVLTAKLLVIIRETRFWSAACQFLLGSGFMCIILFAIDAAGADVPLKLARNRQVIRMVALPYLDDSGRQRMLHVVRETLGLNRVPTVEEIRQLLEKKDDDAKARSSLRYDSFQRNDGYTLFWVLDGEPEQKLETLRPLGVVYAEPTDQIWAADVVWHPAREEYLMVLSNTLRGRSTFAIFPLDLEAKVAVKPFTVVELPVKEWPKPIAPIAEIRLSLIEHLCDINLVRAVPEERIDEFGIQYSLLITAVNSRVGCKPPVMFRYNLRQREWRLLKPNDLNGEVIENYDKDDEEVNAEYKKYGVDLTPPPEKGDPAGSRRPKPLKPVPDASERIPSTPK